ncbi:hypothetical protein SAMN02745163_01546 [Clostridium cavendishii DSM 21758]|uniref:SIR2-like domain-containing protein n=1 Tax=Clostridium cavendishii DSM 21758 TaxID=1121302 RepID=A0A1M6HQG5_9CLOT|nr:hypothetical protein [Clostridium cavendishii]SHJ24431.1 hypothetical protein SAMN02745163_01546 [Clostridium cavendishii DSM 21758]
MKNLYLLIGNGSSISIVNKINDYRKQIGQPPLNIDLSNLFYYGASFNFPMTNDPFLTEEHCPKLWQLGARPGMDRAKANQIISQIITCGNVYALAKYKEEIISTNDFGDYYNNQYNMNILSYYNNTRLTLRYSDNEIISNLYFAAYGEFSSYLRYLMIYYNSQITNNDLTSIDVPLINYIKQNYNNFNRIIFNSYNYDIIMERLLMLNDLPFKLGCFENGCNKIIFYKPHGSISFSYKKTFPLGTQYKIPYNELSFQQKITVCDFNIKYDFINDYPKHNGMVPPYGEAERFEISYYQKIRNSIIRAAKKSNPSDIYYIIGSSYGNVDRFELDRINTSFDKLVHVTYVDPFPNPDYNAVLSSLFINYNQVPDFPTTSQTPILLKDIF